LLLQISTDLNIQSDILIPSIESLITHCVLQFHTTNVRAVCVNRAEFTDWFVMPAGAVPTIEKLCFSREVNMLATQPTLFAGKDWHGSRVIHMHEDEVAAALKRLDHR